MMWGALVFFALLSGVLEVNGEIDCDRVGQSHCQQHLPIRSKGFPGTVEEFQSSCPYILRYFDCLVEYVNACGSENIPDGEILPDTLAFMRDACDPDSDTNAGLRKHLPCLQTHLDNPDEACKDTSNKAFDSYKEANAITDADRFFWDHEYCYRVTSRMACYIARIEESCEAGAKEFVYDAIRRTKYLTTVCDSEKAEKQLELLEVLELNDVMKDRIKELLEN